MKKTFYLYFFSHFIYNFCIYGYHTYIILIIVLLSFFFKIWLGFFIFILKS